SRVEHVASSQNVPCVRVSRRTRAWERSLRLARGLPERWEPPEPIGACLSAPETCLPVQEPLGQPAPEAPEPFGGPGVEALGAVPEAPAEPIQRRCEPFREPLPGSPRALALRAPAPAPVRDSRFIGAMESTAMRIERQATFGRGLKAEREATG